LDVSYGATILHNDHARHSFQSNPWQTESSQPVTVIHIKLHGGRSNLCAI